MCGCAVTAGDHEDVAAQVAAAVGIPSWQSAMRPEHKLQYVQEQEAAAVAGTVTCSPALERLVVHI